MLPDIDLDSESFDDIMENAKNRIVSIYPEWTDLNYHDPGVTMLEMFAWFKEIQQYYLNRIGPENIGKFFKLLGIDRQTKKPSSTQVRVNYHEDLIAAAGTRLYAGEICFEADERTYISCARIICCISVSGGEERVVGRSSLEFGGNLRIMPFPSGNPGEFYIGFDRPLKEGEQHRLYVEISDNDPVKRTPITSPEDFIPLAGMAAEYFDGISWKSMEFIDNTFSFLTSGIIIMKPGSAHRETVVGGSKAYFIRFRFTEGEYDTIPIIRSLEFRLLPVTQRKTLAEYFDLPAGDELRLFTELSVIGTTRIFLRGDDGLFAPVPNFEKRIEESGEVTVSVPDAGDAVSVRIVNYDQGFAADSVIGVGLGLPYQQYELDSDKLEYESFAIMTELPASGGKLVEWKKVKDFSTARADDFVYMLDTDKGVIRFGDCIRGMAPEGRIFLIGCSETLGADGNVSVRKIDRMGDIDDGSIAISNLRRSDGGMNEENSESCCLRAHLLLRSTETLVTDEDIESFITGAQGLKIEKCQIIREKRSAQDPVRSVIVKPWTPDGKGVPSESYKRNILSALEKKRMLGTGFRIISPKYSGVRVFLTVNVERSASNPYDRIKEVIYEFFAAYNNRFGAKLIYSRLYEMIDRLSFVISIGTLSLEIDGSGAQRTREGDLLLSPNVMAYLSDMELVVNTSC